MDWTKEVISENQRITLPLLLERGVELHMKREDLIHPEVSGNKWRKLRYTVLDALSEKDIQGILTKGGAYSNHILATASACHSLGLKAAAFIRGEQVEPLNPTLRRASELGMRLHFLSRSDYKKSMVDLADAYFSSENRYLIPEGGTNDLGIKGCKEILTEKDKQTFDIICVSFGTGGTAAGLLLGKSPRQQLRVYPALKGLDVEKALKDLIPEKLCPEELVVIPQYHFGGYAKIDTELMDFIRVFQKEANIPLDPIYTAKMMYGVMADIRNGTIERGSRVLAIHTGGLQGRAGMEERLGLDFSFQ